MIAAHVANKSISAHWTFLPLAVYGLFLVTYGVDRVLLVRRRRYPVGKALFQIAVGVVFALLLLPSTLEGYKANRHARPAGVERLLRHSDVDVRAAATLSIGFEEATPDRVESVLRMIDDRSPSVRKAAGRVLARWSGRPAHDVGGIRRWASALSQTSTTAKGMKTR